MRFVTTWIICPTCWKNIGLSNHKARFISDRQEEQAYQAATKKWLEETLPANIKKAEEDNSVVLFGDEISFAMSVSYNTSKHQVALMAKVMLSF